MNIEPFINQLSGRSRSAETLRAYRQDLEKYEAFLRMKGLRVTQAKPTTISEFIAYRSEHRGRTVAGTPAPASVARWLAVLSSFYDFLSDNSWGAIKNPVKSVKRPKVQNDEPRAVDDQILNTLFEGITDRRDLAILLVFVYSGLRLSELGQLDKATIRPRRRTLPDGSVEYYGEGLIVGKGRKRREFIVGPKAMLALRHYYNADRKNDAESALFLSNRDSRLSARAIQHVLDRWCKKLNLPHLTVHQLRHSFATRNVNAGMSAIVLQQLMGHSNLQTTQRYFRVKTDRIRREYFAAMEYMGHE